MTGLSAITVCLTYMLSTSGLHELQAGVKIGRRNNNNLRYVNDTTLMAKSKEELKSFMIRVKEKNERVNLRVNVKKKC